MHVHIVDIFSLLEGGMLGIKVCRFSTGPHTNIIQLYCRYAWYGGRFHVSSVGTPPYRIPAMNGTEDDQALSALGYKQEFKRYVI